MTASPVPNLPDVEQVGPDEDATIEQLNAAFDTILERTAQDYGQALRAVHAKAHGVLEGELTVDGGLPPELAQGLFAVPGTHRVLIRLSTNAGDILPDSIGLSRGLAMEVFDVGGERLPGAEGNAQDFVMVNSPAFQAKSADATGRQPGRRARRRFDASKRRLFHDQNGWRSRCHAGRLLLHGGRDTRLSDLRRSCADREPGAC